MIEVNEYVRTDEGEIARVTSVAKETLGETLGIDEYRDIGFCNTETYVKGKIVKHSKQLIDLIEVGDIVNDCIVVGFGYECVNGNKEKSIHVEGKYTKVNYALLNWDIEIILTKESYMANCYKVGGEDE